MMLAFRHSGVSQRALPPLLAVRSIPLQQPTTTFAIAQPLQAPCTSPETENTKTLFRIEGDRLNKHHGEPIRAFLAFFFDGDQGRSRAQNRA
jgi:hypothetical protein